MSQIEPMENVDYDDVYETIQNDAQKRGLSDDDIWKIWQAGIAAKRKAIGVLKILDVTKRRDDEIVIHYTDDDVIHHLRAYPIDIITWRNAAQHGVEPTLPDRKGSAREHIRHVVESAREK